MLQWCSEPRRSVSQQHIFHLKLLHRYFLASRAGKSWLHSTSLKPKSEPYCLYLPTDVPRYPWAISVFCKSPFLRKRHRPHRLNTRAPGLSVILGTFRLPDSCSIPRCLLQWLSQSWQGFPNPSCQKMQSLSQWFIELNRWSHSRTYLTATISDLTAQSQQLALMKLETCPKL